MYTVLVKFSKLASNCKPLNNNNTLFAFINTTCQSITQRFILYTIKIMCCQGDIFRPLSGHLQALWENRSKSWKQKTNLMSLAILFHFLCVQHVSDINISIIRSLRLCCWITTLVVCSWFDVCWSFGVVGLEWYPCGRLKQPATRIPPQPNHTETPTHIEPRTIRPMWQFNSTVASSWWWIY